MDPKLKKPLVSSFKATDPQIAYLSLTAAAIILNTSAIIGISQGQKSGKGTRVSVGYLLNAKIPRYFDTLKICF